MQIEGTIITNRLRDWQKRHESVFIQYLDLATLYSRLFERFDNSEVAAAAQCSGTSPSHSTPLSLYFGVLWQAHSASSPIIVRIRSVTTFRSASISC